ncbi:MAG: single-stranded DNA-binding protein [Bacteroidetes bacterium]|uniref:Single-stranded DNA-binding protein n=1 Tax=Candidatus Merdivivens pullicola TaxID=2840872 RepID=A0A9D9IIA4_9BACT|nr:single-stranded DNA-binding protein [Candidatus Merdivivens pullicola]
MDYTLNRIEVRGNVGEDARISKFGDNCVARFQVATNYSYRDKDGQPVIETTWHNIVAWEGRGMPDFALIKKGAFIYACGRLRVSKFTNSEGEEKRVYEIVANRLQLVKPEDFA